MRNLLILFIVACSLFFTACDLLTSPANPNYLNDLQEELAWANAQRLTVSIVVPFGWGNSNPGEGLIRTIDIRKGEGERYGFDVEFIPNSGFGFRGWLAFTNSAYENIASSLNTLSFETLRDEHSLYREGVTIIPKETFTASFLSRITINVSEQVILVPFSDTRPQVVRSNPPLVPAISPFPYDQRIIIWFNMGIDEDTVKIGEIIRISAVDRLGQPVGVNGDISDYFTVRVYDPLDFRLEIAPKDNDDFPAFDLQLLNISVEIGRSIRSTGENSFEMPAVQTVTYLTDSTQAQKIYEANNIQVSRRYPVTTENPLFGDFGTHWGNPMIDRRFNRVGTEHPLSPQFDYNTAHIQFTVAVPDGAPSEPNRIFIYEQLFADLGGFAVTTNLMGPFSYEDITPIGGFYSISHSLRTIHSGIIRLIVIPWNESMSEHGSADTEHFIPQELTAAVAASHFVTIVMDDEAPHMNDMGAVLSGGTLEGGVYNFARNANFTLTLERLHLLSDNGIHGGIHFNEAWSRPWTMDDRRYLEWRVTVPGTVIDSGWQRVVIDNVVVNTFSHNTNGLSETGQHLLMVEFRDRMGNVSPPVEAVKFAIVGGSPVEVTDLSANVNTAGNQITISWTTPTLEDAAMQGARVYVNGRDEATVTGTGVRSHVFNVSVINANNVRNGQAVSNVMQYDIEVIGYNAARDANAEKLTIWNIPGMNVTQTNTLQINREQITENNGLLIINNLDLASNIVLTTDIDLDAHVPIGMAGQPFTGKFYGNGHTITINSLGETAADINPSDWGLFGVANNALIRDLTVVYAEGITVSVTSGAHNVGSIAGHATNTEILNCIVRGVTDTAELSVNATSGTGQIRLGGIVGYIAGSGIIENSRAALSVAYSSAGHTGIVRIGGITGETGAGSGRSIPINNGFTSPNPILPGLLINSVNVAVNVKADKGAYTGDLLIGGAAGYSIGNTMNDVVFTGGTVSFNRSARDINYCGGLIGESRYTNIVNSSFTGTIRPINPASSVDGAARIGGLIGFNLNNASGFEQFIDNCAVQGNIEINTIWTTNIGGAIGRSFNQFGRSITITNSFFEGLITISGATSTQVGGFSGYFDGDHIMNNCGAMAGTIDVNAIDGHIWVGGFTSEYTGALSNCFSKMDIITKSTRRIFVGGFAGLLDVSSSTISNCYASGAIRSVGTEGSDFFYVGGLVGNNNGTIRDSYALGNVLADNPNGTIVNGVQAGGLVGGTSGDIRNSFSAGQVIAQSNNSAAYAGGLVGRITNGAISNTAALGASVTAKGETKHAGRISGSPTNNTQIGSNNRAKQSMRIEEGAYTQTLFSNLIDPADAGDNTRWHGETFSDSMFFNQFFWEGSGSLGFTTTNWNFLRVGSEGFPRLRNVGGQ